MTINITTARSALAGALLAGACLTAIAAPAFAQEKTVMVGGAAMYPSKNIVENAVNSKDHTTLVAAVKAAGLVDTLSGKGPFTVFAPTNAAFAKLPAGTVETLVKPESKATLTKILTYHVVPGTHTAADVAKAVKDGNGKATMKTVQGETLTFMEAPGHEARSRRCEGRQVHGDDRRRDAVERRHPCRRHGADALIGPGAPPGAPYGSRRLAVGTSRLDSAAVAELPGFSVRSGSSTPSGRGHPAGRRGTGAITMNRFAATLLVAGSGLGASTAAMAQRVDQHFGKIPIERDLRRWDRVEERTETTGSVQRYQPYVTYRRNGPSGVAGFDGPPGIVGDSVGSYGSLPPGAPGNEDW